MAAVPAVDEVKKIIKSLVIPYQNGLTPIALDNEYLELEGRPIPWKPLGYTSLVAFLRTLGDAVTFRFNKAGEEALFAQADDSVAHIQRLVQGQKPQAIKRRNHITRHDIDLAKRCRPAQSPPRRRRSISPDKAFRNQSPPCGDVRFKASQSGSSPPCGDVRFKSSQPVPIPPAPSRPLSPALSNIGSDESSLDDYRASLRREREKRGLPSRSERQERTRRSPSPSPRCPSPPRNRSRHRKLSHSPSPRRRKRGERRSPSDTSSRRSSSRRHGRSRDSVVADKRRVRDVDSSSSRRRDEKSVARTQTEPLKVSVSIQTDLDDDSTVKDIFTKPKTPPKFVEMETQVSSSLVSSTNEQEQSFISWPSPPSPIKPAKDDTKYEAMDMDVEIPIEWPSDSPPRKEKPAPITQPIMPNTPKPSFDFSKPVEVKPVLPNSGGPASATALRPEQMDTSKVPEAAPVSARDPRLRKQLEKPKDPRLERKQQTNVNKEISPPQNSSVWSTPKASFSNSNGQDFQWPIAPSDDQNMADPIDDDVDLNLQYYSQDYNYWQYSAGNVYNPAFDPMTQGGAYLPMGQADPYSEDLNEFVIDPTYPEDPDNPGKYYDWNAGSLQPLPMVPRWYARYLEGGGIPYDWTAYHPVGQAATYVPSAVPVPVPVPVAAPTTTATVTAPSISRPTDPRSAKSSAASDANRKKKLSFDVYLKTRRVENGPEDSKKSSILINRAPVAKPAAPSIPVAPQPAVPRDPRMRRAMK